MNANGRRPGLRFTVIPMSSCGRCSGPDDLRYGVPIAQAGPVSHRTIRYACVRCRAVWDVSWNVAALADFFPNYEAFADTFIRAAEGLESHPREGIDFPAGPRSAFVQSRVRQQATL